MTSGAFDENLFYVSKDFQEIKMFLTCEQLKDILENRVRSIKENNYGLDTSEVSNNYSGFLAVCPEQDCGNKVTQALLDILPPVWAQKAPKLKNKNAAKFHFDPLEKTNNTSFLKVCGDFSDTTKHNKSLEKLDEKCISSTFSDASNFHFKGQSMSCLSLPKSAMTLKEAMFTFDEVRLGSPESSSTSSDIPVAISTSTALNQKEDILLLDCRSFISFNAGHIILAKNVCFPNIMQRRCKKKLVTSVTKDGVASGNCIDSKPGPIYHFSKNYPADVHNVAHATKDFNVGEYDNRVKPTHSSDLNLTEHSSLRCHSPSTKPFLPLENMITCLQTRKKLLSEEFDLVVIYDEGEDQMVGAGAFSEKMMLVLNTLCSSLPEGQRSKLKCLHGGYSMFSQHYPQLIEKQDVDFKEFSPPPSSSNNFSTGRDRIKWSAHGDRGDPTEILPWLFLGSAYHADQTERLYAMGITALLNVASKEVLTEERSITSPASVFQHACIPVVDSLTSEIGCHFDSAISFIEKVHEERGKVLVHCSAGVSRSPAVCLAYLISYFKYTLEEAYDFLRSKRACIAPNLNFMRQLQEFETTHLKNKFCCSDKTGLLLNGCTTETKSRTNSGFLQNLEPSTCKSIQNLCPVIANDDMERLNFIIKTYEPFKNVHQRRRSKFMLNLASLYMENGLKSRNVKIKIQKMLQCFSRSYTESPISRKLISFLMSAIMSSHSRSALRFFLRNSSALTNLEPHEFMLSNIEHPLELSCALVIHTTKRSDRKSFMARDFQSRVKKVKDKKDGFIEEDDHLSSKKHTFENTLCNYFVLQEKVVNENFDAVDSSEEKRNHILQEDSAVERFCNLSGRNSHISNFNHTPQQERKLSAETSTEMASPAKRARPNSLTNRQHNSRMMVHKLLQPWQHGETHKFTFQASASFPLDSTSSLPHSPENRQLQKIPLMASSLGSLQQSFMSNSIPSLEAAPDRTSSSLPSSSSPQNLYSHVHNKRKAILTLLTPTCNQEAAFSFEPCQPPTPMGGLLPSPTMCHSPLLSPS